MLLVLLAASVVPLVLALVLFWRRWVEIEAERERAKRAYWRRMASAHDPETLPWSRLRRKQKGDDAA